MKKYFAVLLIAVMLFSLAACQSNNTKEAEATTAGSGIVDSIAEKVEAVQETETSMEKILIGDVDFDGQITIMDATMIQKYVAQEMDFNENEKLAADTDGNTIINNDDTTAIQEYLVKENEKVKLVGDYVIQ